MISPHIDDEVLGCSSALDSETHVIECGVDDFHIVSRDERLNELTDVKNLRGFNFTLLENEVNSYKQNKIINEITDAVNYHKPTEIYIPYPSYNQDHQEVYKASLVALRPHDKNYFVKKVFVYEETQVNDWDFSHSINTGFKPNYFKKLDIDLKIKSYQLMVSQVRKFRSSDYLRNIARLRGYQSGMEFAEAFQCIRFVE